MKARTSFLPILVSFIESLVDHFILTLFQVWPRTSHISRLGGLFPHIFRGHVLRRDSLPSNIAGEVVKFLHFHCFMALFEAQQWQSSLSWSAATSSTPTAEERTWTLVPEAEPCTRATTDPPGSTALTAQEDLAAPGSQRSLRRHRRKSRTGTLSCEVTLWGRGGWQGGSGECPLCMWHHHSANALNTVTFTLWKHLDGIWDEFWTGTGFDFDVTLCIFNTVFVSAVQACEFLQGKNQDTHEHTHD